MEEESCLCPPALSRQQETQPSSSHSSANGNTTERSHKRELSNEQIVVSSKKTLIRETSTTNYDSVLSHPQQSVSHHDQQIINIFNIVENNHTSIAQSRQLDVPSISHALETYYKDHLKIRLVSGKTLELEECFVNLAIVEATIQEKIEKEKLKTLSQTFNRMESYEDLAGVRLESTIQIEQLFERRKLRDGREDIPKKILIQGRAGIGKTTLCKKLVQPFIGGKWSDLFEAALWISLRDLKIYKPRNLHDLLKKIFFTHYIKETRDTLSKKIQKEIERGMILIILDGLDEIIQDIQVDPIMKSFLENLLQQKHTPVIVTSRPSGVDYSILPAIDLRLESVGFSTTNINSYVNNVLEGEAAKSVMEFIEKTPIIQSLANIPVQLDVLCYIWESLQLNDTNILTNTLTITKLYQAIVGKLLRSDGVRLRKSDGRSPISAELMNTLREYQVDRIMSTEVEYLSYLAFNGIKGNQIEFDYLKLDKVAESLDSFREQSYRDPLPFNLLDTLKQTSFLHTVKGKISSQDNLEQQSYHFIHLTFQEYFAAKWVSRYFPIKKSNPMAPALINRDEIIAFIQENKYNTRYEIVWRMIAGLLEGEALESYFQLLHDAPRDLIGLQHQHLIAGCYQEAQHQLSEKLANKIQSDMNQWLQFEMEYQKDSKFLNLYPRHSRKLLCNVPEELLIKDKDDKAYTKWILNELTYRRYLKPRTVEYLVQKLSDIDPNIITLAKEALGNQSTMSVSMIKELNELLQNRNSIVQEAAAYVLRKQSTMSESSISQSMTTVQAPDPDAQQEIVNPFSKQSTNSDSTITSPITSLQNPDSDVRSALVDVLGEQSAMSDSKITALVSILSDPNTDPNVRKAVADELSRQSTMSVSTIFSLIAILQNQNPVIQEAAGNSLRDHSTSRKSILYMAIDIIIGRNSMSLEASMERQIVQLFRDYLMDYSYNDRVSIFIHENRLNVCTVQGFEDPKELSEEEIKKLKSVILDIQKSHRINIGE